MLYLTFETKFVLCIYRPRSLSRSRFLFRR